MVNVAYSEAQSPVSFWFLLLTKRYILGKKPRDAQIVSGKDA